MSQQRIKPAPDVPECIQPVIEGGRYRNPWPMVPVHPDFENKPLRRGGKHVPYTDDELKWLVPVLSPIFEHETDEEGVLRATWLGHSSMWVKMEGLSILFDPVLVDTIEQPTDPEAEIHRLREPPCMIEEFPMIDVVIISHNHSGHLNAETCQQIIFHFPDVRFFVPKGVGQFFHNLGAENVTEMGWWEETALMPDGNHKVVCLPCQHWSMTNFEDVNESLWASWAVIGDRYRVYHLGDSGYCDVFKTIGKRYGPFDLAMIPIGGYVPRAQVKPWHMHPIDAIKTHQDLKSKQSIALHWTTWFYGLGKAEHYLEPKKLLWEEGIKQGIYDHLRRVTDFIVLWIGQTWCSENHGLDGCLLSDPI